MALRVDGRLFTAYLAATAFVTGALVMVIEVLGSRVIGPYFGVSLFVWTSLITVTLVALAAGYTAGGRLADRFGSPDALYALVIAAGVAALPIPLLKPLLLPAVAPLGLRTGALLSATLLFGPALFLLGCVAPFIVRMAVRELATVGRTVGAFYAVSTLGSVLGTALAGFYLIPMLGVDRIFIAAGALLIVIGAAYFVLFRRVWWAVAALMLPLAFLPRPLPATVFMPDGTQVTIVHSRDSAYGRLAVVDYSHGELGTRELTIDGLVQGGIDRRTGQSVYEYTYLLQWLPVALKPGGSDCLVIGLGAGVIPAWYQQRGVETDVVDIDPHVIELARAFFAYEPQGQVFNEDARTFLSKPGKRYDYIILDVFTGDTTPSHLLTLESLRLIKARQSERSVLALNLAGSLRRETFMTASVIGTLKAVYTNVEMYPTFGWNDGDGVGNVIVLAYEGVPAAPGWPRQVEEPMHALAAVGVRQALSAPFQFPSATPAIVLRDGHNPMDALDVWLKERVRQNVLESTHPRILLGG